MKVFLTGGTGFIGSAVLGALIDQGHQVTALVRSSDSAAAVAAAGATAIEGDLTDVPWLVDQLAVTDAAVHTASPGDATSQAVDGAIARAAVAAYTGTDRSYVHTGGVWIYGSNPAITEASPFDPPAMVAWRAGVEQLVLGTDGLRGVVVVPGVVHGQAKGLPNLLAAAAPRDPDGALHLVGDGSQHWVTVYADDIADLYVRAVTTPDATGYYVGTDGRNPSVRELVQAASSAAGAGGAVRPETVEQTRARLGEAFADALLLDQHAVVADSRAHRELGWTPVGPALVDELAAGQYRG